MSRFIKSIFMLCLLACVPLVMSLPASAGDLPENAEGMAEEAASEEAAPEETMVEEAPLVKDTDVSIYGRFWPRVTYKDNGESSTDITDAAFHGSVLKLIPR